MANEATLHQFLHGYDRGHRLLAASTDVQPNVAAEMDRASDAVPGYRSSSGPYLTGYTLPDGSWALARTWPAADAQRPNTVWTHTVVVPVPLIGRVSAAGLAAQLRDPAGRDYTAFRVPLPVSTDAAVAGPTRRAAAAAVAIYEQDEVVLPALDANDRDAVALALWDQHWMPLRRTLTFCTAPDVVPSLATVERLLLFSQRASASPQTTLPGVVADDLCRRSALREWVHFVGSGERDAALMVTFARLYLVLHDGEGSADTVQQAEDILQSAGPAPRDLRRLKRRLLSFTDGKPRWSVPPDVVLAALAHDRLGRLTAADDASLPEWVATAWRSSPTETAATLASVRAGPRAESADDGLLCAADAVADVFDSSLESLLTPHTVATASATVPARVLTVLAKRNEEALWAAWAELPADLRAATLASRAAAPETWKEAIRGTWSHPDAVRALLDAWPAAVGAVVDQAARSPRRFGADLYPLPDAAARLLVDDLASAEDAQRVRALSHLASPTHLPKRANWTAWQQTTVATGDHVVAAIAYLLGRRAAPREGLELAAVALTRLYPLLADHQANDVWSRLTGRISGDQGSWDRCGRLAADYATHLAKRDPATVSHLVGIVHHGDRAAALAVTDALAHTKRSDGLLKSITDLFRW